MAEELADQPKGTAEELADQPDKTAEELADQPEGNAEGMSNAEYAFSGEQGQLRDAVAAFCAEHIDESAVRAQMESDPPFDAKVWARLGSELGVLGLSVPESRGGVGGSLIDQAVEVIQEAAKTGKIGDGKIFVYDVSSAVRIRTGETGDEAL